MAGGTRFEDVTCSNGDFCNSRRSEAAESMVFDFRFRWMSSEGGPRTAPIVVSCSAMPCHHECCAAHDIDFEIKRVEI